MFGIILVIIVQQACEMRGVSGDCRGVSMECSAEELLRLLLDSSERAAELARTCRRDPLFEQGVQSKPDLVKNSSTVQDFKTVADVTVQVMVRHQIAAKVRPLAMPTTLMRLTVTCNLTRIAAWISLRT